MPIIEFSVPPWVLFESDQLNVVSTTKNLLSLRENHTQYLTQSTKEGMESGLPVIRPMWWSNPNDHVTWTIDDQYYVGDDLLVAPIVTTESDARKVYLPDGKWVGKDHEVKKGPRWITVSASSHEVPIFYKVSP